MDIKKLIIIAAIAAFASCCKIEDSKDIDKAWCYHGMTCHTKTVEIEGHKYIIMYGSYAGSIIHAASCPCMNK